MSKCRCIRKVEIQDFQEMSRKGKSKETENRQKSDAARTEEEVADDGCGAGG